MARYNKYQYETSPRKLEPEYKMPKRTYPKKRTAPQTKSRAKSKETIIRKKHKNNSTKKDNSN